MKHGGQLGTIAIVLGRDKDGLDQSGSSTGCETRQDSEHILKSRAR